MDQVWSGNRALLDHLRADHTPLGKARLRYFLLNKGAVVPELDGNEAFLPGGSAPSPPEPTSTRKT